MLTTIGGYNDERRAVREKSGRKNCHCAAAQARQMLFSQEVEQTRADSASAHMLCLEDLNCRVAGEHWSGTPKWDLIYSSDLLSSLPKVAARQVLKTAAAVLKPGGRLLFANAAQYADFPACHFCSASKIYRTELDMAELACHIPDDQIAGQAVFYDDARLNLYLEIHRRT